jgi:hypothetical protein
MPARVRSERTSLSNCAKAAKTPSISFPVEVSSIGSVAERKEIPSDFRWARSAKWSYFSRANRVRLYGVRMTTDLVDLVVRQSFRFVPQECATARDRVRVRYVVYAVHESPHIQSDNRPMSVREMCAPQRAGNCGRRAGCRRADVGDEPTSSPERLSSHPVWWLLAVAVRHRR